MTDPKDFSERYPSAIRSEEAESKRIAMNDTKTEPPISMIAAAQKAILSHPFFDGGAAVAFGIANAAVKAALCAKPQSDEALSKPSEAVSVAMIENTDAEQIERLNARIIELLRERDALVKALTDLCDEIASEEMHGDGAHDGNCQTCRAHRHARKLLRRMLEIVRERRESPQESAE